MNFSEKRRGFRPNIQDKLAHIHKFGIIFLKEYFCVQKSLTPGVAIGVDQAGEQLNSEDKSHG